MWTLVRNMDMEHICRLTVYNSTWPEVEYPGVRNFLTSLFLTFSSPEPRSYIKIETEVCKWRDTQAREQSIVRVPTHLGFPCRISHSSWHSEQLQWVCLQNTETTHSADAPPCPEFCLRIFLYCYNLQRQDHKKNSMNSLVKLNIYSSARQPFKVWSVGAVSPQVLWCWNLPPAKQHALTRQCSSLPFLQCNLAHEMANTKSLRFNLTHVHFPHMGKFWLEEIARAVSH